ncbi:MAG: hypothetical protein CM15mP73_1030 [Hyphomicrobiales bacterium]|nr:MAG: hypothetical protein CM15mP73_1030 [Hyphomicrobiales bacterium]
MAAFSDITHNLDANKTATQYIEDKIDEIVKNKKKSEALKPRSIVGCKRLVIESITSIHLIEEMSSLLI